MRIKLLSLVMTLLVGTMSRSQGLTISPGVAVRTSPGVDIVLQRGTLTNNGDGDLSNSSLYMRGDTTGNIGGTTASTVANLYIDNGSSVVRLGNDLNVKNNVVFQNGLLNLNNHNLLLSPSGLLVGESEANHITGASGGYVSITVNLNAPAGANPGNLGALITSPKNLGSVTVQRGHKSQTNSGTGKSILRYFNIQPSNNSALSAVFRLTYLDAELNGLAENNLKMWRSTNGGTSWTSITASGQSTSLDFVEISNQGALYRYTLSPSPFSLNNAVAAGSIENMRRDSKTALAKLFPNPALVRTMLTIAAGQTFKTQVTIFTTDGKKVLQQPINLQAGINQLSIDVSALTQGAYYLTVQMNDGSQRNISFIKE